MGLMNEYIDKKMSVDDLRKELDDLVKKYKKATGHYFLIYSVDMQKGDYPISLDMSDYYILSDILTNTDEKDVIDVYLETPGGSGEVAEAIANLLHKKFATVNFIISGEAKSAGTILALSGNDIFMTETGSLGPIDAQCRIGRSVVSAYDYINWLKERQKDKALTPKDATIIAQISPGELYGIQNALDYAKDLVVEWLPKYKFSKWKTTETRKKPVTKQMKRNRARKIANSLTNHKRWKTHARSLDIDKLNEIQLHIDSISGDRLELVQRIQVVIRLLFMSSGIYKIYYTSTKNGHIFKTATSATQPIIQPINMQPPAIPFNVKCEKCSLDHKLFAKIENIENSPLIESLKNQGFIEVPKSRKITCNCGAEIDISPIINDIEANIHRKVL